MVVTDSIAGVEYNVDAPRVVIDAYDAARSPGTPNDVVSSVYSRTSPVEMLAGFHKVITDLVRKHVPYKVVVLLEDVGFKDNLMGVKLAIFGIK